MQTIEELRKKHAEEIAKLEAEIHVRAMLPGEPAFIFKHNDHVSVSYDFTKLGDAVNFAESFPGSVPAFQFSGTYSHFKPASLISKGRDSAKDWANQSKRQALECVAELRLHSFRLSNENGFQSQCSLEFFAEIQGVVFSIQCRIGTGHGSMYPPHYLTMRPVMNGSTHQSSVARWDSPPAIQACHSRSVRFSTGSGAGKAVDARFYYTDWDSVRLVVEECEG